MARLLITDIGGVLIKTDDAIVGSIKKVCSENGVLEGNMEGLMENFGVSLYDYILGYLPEGSKDKAEKCYGDFKKVYPDKATHLMKVFSGVDDALRKIILKGIKIAVLSCMIRKEVNVNLSLLDFDDFDLVYSLDDYHFKRPDPHGLLDIARRLGVDPSDCVYIGDTPNDIRMAKNSGMKSVAVRTGMVEDSLLEKEQPDHLIDSFEEIIEIL